MFFNNIKLAVRHIFKDKPGTAIHLLGLSVGIAGFLFLLQYVFFEKSYDQFHKRSNDLFRVTVDVYRNGELSVESATSYLALSPALKNDFPEVEAFTRFFALGALISLDEKRFREEQVFYVDSSLFNVFSFPLLSGDPTTALIEPNSAVISESTARRYFETIDCLGKSFEVQNWGGDRVFTVTGVMADIPVNSHLQTDVFLSLSTFLQTPGVLSEWEWRDFYNYLVLKPGTASVLEQKINASDYIANNYERYRQHNITQELHLQPVTDIHLGSDLSLEPSINGDRRAVNLLLLIGLFILLMAWINYINLTTAKAVTRAKEVGVRKTIGARRVDLIWQFLTQSLVINGLAIGVAISMVSFLQPLYQQIVGKAITFQWVQDPWLISGLVLLSGLGLTLSSAYPAFVLSGFSPQSVFNLNKIGEKMGGVFIRKALIVFQFGMSILLIVGTITVFQQLTYMQQKDIGMDLSQTLSVRMPNVRDSLTAVKANLAKERLLQHRNIQGVAAAHVLPGDQFLWVPGIRRLSDDPDNNVSKVIYLNAIDPAFIPQFGLEVLAGRSFYPEEPEETRSMVLTETACRSFGITDYETALGQRYICMGDTFSIVGVVSDYQQWGVQKKAGDYVFINRPDEFRKFAVKVAAQDLSATIDFIENTYKDIFPGDLFEYAFLDRHFARQYEADVQFGRLTAIFAGLAVFIACLGLLGLSLFMVMQRRKEIGIRKVLGATIANLVGLLSIDFLKLVLLALLIASPVAYYLMENWLQDFAYRIELQWWIFVVAGVGALAVGFLAVSFQSVKAALANPVDSLRSE